MSDYGFEPEQIVLHVRDLSGFKPTEPDFSETSFYYILMRNVKEGTLWMEKHYPQLKYEFSHNLHDLMCSKDYGDRILRFYVEVI